MLALRQAELATCDTSEHDADLRHLRTILARRGVSAMNATAVLDECIQQVHSSAATQLHLALVDAVTRMLAPKKRPAAVAFELDDELTPPPPQSDLAARVARLEAMLEAQQRRQEYAMPMRDPRIEQAARRFG